jgi:hypothetical protein
MPRKPSQKPGAAFRSAVLAEYELKPQESVLLDAAAGTLDTCAKLEARVAAEGTMSAAGKPSASLVELRQLAEELGVPESHVYAALDQFDKNGDVILCFKLLPGGFPAITDNRSAH